MILKKLLNILIGYSILLQAALFQVALPNLVLCFGEDGHIEFEWQSEDSQCAADDLLDSTIFSDSNKDIYKSNEDNCTDINLHFHHSIADKTKIKYYSDYSVNKTVFYNSDFIEDSKSFSLNNNKNASIINPTIGVIKNTVLII